MDGGAATGPAMRGPCRGGGAGNRVTAVCYRSVTAMLVAPERVRYRRSGHEAYATRRTGRRKFVRQADAASCRFP